MLIWQEFLTIASDVWGKVVSAARLAFGFSQHAAKVIAANFQPLLVMGIGWAIGIPLTLIPFAALIDALFEPLRSVFNDIRVPWFPGVSGFVFILMFCFGIGTLWFSTELADRIWKRLEGKPKDKEIMRTGEEVLEVIEAIKEANDPQSEA